MFKLLLVTICLTLSPAFGIVEQLYSTEKSCYTGCHSNYLDTYANLEACKAGCDYKFYGENCAKQCKLYSMDKQVQASCIDGCAMSHAPATAEQSLVAMPVHTLKTLLQKLKEKAESQVKSVIILVKKPHDHQHEDKLDHLHEYFQNVPHKVHQMIHIQSKIAMIILSTALIIISVLLISMIISICRKTARQSESAIAYQELVHDNHSLRPSTPIKVKLIDV